MDRLFTRLGRLTVRRRGRVLAAWIVILGFGIAFAPRLQEVFDRQFVTGNTGESQAAADIVRSEFTSRSPFGEQLVITSETRTVDEPAYRDAAQALMRVTEATGLVASVDGYYTTGDRSFVSGDGHTTYLILNLTSTTHSDGMNASRRIIDAIAGASTPPQPRPPTTRSSPSTACAASAAPLAESPTSTHPVKSPSAFQVLSPCRSSIRVDMRPSLAASQSGNTAQATVVALPEVHARAATLPPAHRDHQRSYLTTRTARHR